MPCPYLAPPYGHGMPCPYLAPPYGHGMPCPYRKLLGQIIVRHICDDGLSS